jgi:hypothetical protein
MSIGGGKASSVVITMDDFEGALERVGSCCIVGWRLKFDFAYCYAGGPDLEKMTIHDDNSDNEA